MINPIKHETSQDIQFMQIALEEAKLAGLENEVPIGACVVYDGRVIARAHNRRESDKSPCAHAEFIALQRASEVLDRWRLSGCTVYVTLEPCLMCAGLMVNSRIDRCVFGSYDPKGGALGTLYSLQSDERLNHEFEVVGGVCEEECSQVLKDFFARRRKERKAAKREGTFQKPQAEEVDELLQARVQINAIDQQIFALFGQRLHVSELVARYKQENNLPILDTSREDDKLSWASEIACPDCTDLYTTLMQCLMDLSKKHQLSISQNMDSIQENING